MINQTTEQLMKDSSNLKDLELLLCQTMAGKLIYLEGNLQSIIDEHLEEERGNLSYGPEGLCISLYHELRYLKELLEDFKSKSQEINANTVPQPEETNLTLKL